MQKKFFYITRLIVLYNIYYFNINSKYKNECINQNLEKASIYKYILYYYI